MSYFPAGVQYNNTSATGIRQNEAMATAEQLFATYSTTLNFDGGSTAPYLLFTTDANRGRFFPIKIAIAAVKGSSNGLSSSSPVVRIGWFNRSNPYDNWVSAASCQSILDNTFGAGYYNNITLQTWEAFLSAPPSTDVYLSLVPSSVAGDFRIVTVLGLYTG